jgi:hypothetical protein
MAPVDNEELQAVLANDLGRRSGSRSRRTGVIPEPKMSIPRTVAEILREHVTLEVEGIDRMYLNVYVPALQRAGGVASFFRFPLGHRFASGALMDPITKAFIGQMEQFAEQEKVPVVAFEKGQRKDDVAAAYRKKFTGREGVLFIGKAQEKPLCSAPNGGAMSRPARPIRGWFVPPPWSITFTPTAGIKTSVLSC